MLFRELVELVGHAPVFATELLLRDGVDVASVQRQLSRWTAGGSILQLRRGLYALAPPFMKVKPHPFLLANRLVAESYVSGLSALSYYGMTTEPARITTSVTTGRPGCWSTPLGEFSYRHVKDTLFHGYQQLTIGGGQSAAIATPEKALLDLFYLQPAGDARAYLHSLRLQNMERLDVAALRQFARQAQSPKLTRAAALLSQLVRADLMEYQQM